MTTLARRHFQRVSAAQASAGTDAGEPVNANAYELVLAQLAEDRRKLKQLQSVERRIEAKRLMLPAYQPWVDGALEGGKGGQDAVLTTMMVWKIDVDDFDGALDIAEYALKHDLVLPDQFKRGVATLVVEEIADKALKALSTRDPAPVDALARLVDLTADTDMPDEVRAKLFKAFGLGMEQQAEQPPAAMLEYLQRAYQLHDKVGVKKDIERIERAIKNNPPSAETAVDPPGTDDTGNVPGQSGTAGAATAG